MNVNHTFVMRTPLVHGGCGPYKIFILKDNYEKNQKESTVLPYIKIKSMIQVLNLLLKTKPKQTNTIFFTIKIESKKGEQRELNIEV